MIKNLPQLWTTAKINELCAVPQERGRASVTPYLEIGNVSVVFKNYMLTGKPSVKGCRIAKRHDILISKVRPTRGAITYVREEELHISSAFTVLRNMGAMAEKYLWMFLAWNHYYLNHLGENCTGTMYPTTSDDVIVNFEVPLAPLSEQRRIVAKLEKLLAKVETCKERLDKIPALLKRFRQSVLVAACSGRLTADWREGNPDVESAINLLSRIKEQRLSQAQNKKERTQAEEAFQELHLRAANGELECEDIPESWICCIVGAIGTVCNGSTPSRKRLDFWVGNIPWVSSGEVRNNIIRETREKITGSGYESSSVRLLPRGTVLLAMIGEGKTRGQTAILDIEATINQNIAAIILDHGLLHSEYLWRWLQLQYQETRERGSGSGPQALNCQRVRELPFVLPPLAEQHEIIRRVEALCKIADRIEERYKKAKAYIDKLTPSILAKAFRGELVPQDPNDESASFLLNRIRQESRER